VNSATPTTGGAFLIEPSGLLMQIVAILSTSIFTIFQLSGTPWVFNPRMARIIMRWLEKPPATTRGTRVLPGTGLPQRSKGRKNIVFFFVFFDFSCGQHFRLFRLFRGSFPFSAFAFSMSEFQRFSFCLPSSDL
jgi:hypothetical protein